MADPGASAEVLGEGPVPARALGPSIFASPPTLIGPIHLPSPTFWMSTFSEPQGSVRLLALQGSPAGPAPVAFPGDTGKPRSPRKTAA